MLYSRNCLCMYLRCFNGLINTTNQITLPPQATLSMALVFGVAGGVVYAVMTWAEKNVNSHPHKKYHNGWKILKKY